ncbi:MAG: hypothetical protein ACO3XO_02775 [Bdellovibrionota bacterium]
MSVLMEIRGETVGANSLAFKVFSFSGSGIETIDDVAHPHTSAVYTIIGSSTTKLLISI